MNAEKRGCHSMVSAFVLLGLSTDVNGLNGLGSRRVEDILLSILVKTIHEEIPELIFLETIT
jgi:hypothetical protein